MLIAVEDKQGVIKETPYWVADPTPLLTSFPVALSS